jgi:hypothetical protein
MNETPQAPVPAKLRWARAQRFRLTARGTESLTAWNAGLAGVQGADGRGAFDQMRVEWAKTFKAQSEDGLLISELSGAPLRLEDLLKSLEDTGATRDDVKDGLERLHGAGLIEPVAAS